MTAVATTGARSQGAVLLVRLGETQDEIARVCGVSRQAVQYWMSGAKKPAAAMRVILLNAYGIPVEAWDQAPTPSAPVSTPPRDEVSRGPAPTIDELGEAVRRQAQSIIVRIETSHDMTDLERTRLLEKLWQIVKPTPDDRKLYKSKQWLALRERLVAAIEQFPEAREAIMLALEAVEDVA